MTVIQFPGPKNVANDNGQDENNLPEYFRPSYNMDSFTVTYTDSDITISVNWDEMGRYFNYTQKLDSLERAMSELSEMLTERPELYEYVNATISRLLQQLKKS